MNHYSLPFRFCPYSKKDIFLDSMAVTAKEWTFLALTYDGTTQEMGIFKDDLYGGSDEPVRTQSI